MDHWQRVLPMRVLEVEYEETVAGPGTRGAAAGRVVRPGTGNRLRLAFHEGKRPVRTASVSRVRQPIYNRSVARRGSTTSLRLQAPCSTDSGEGQRPINSFPA